MKKIPYVIGIIAVLSLMFAVSCSKKEEAGKSESRVQAAETQSEALEPTPAPEPDAAPPETGADVKIEAAQTPAKESAPASAPAVTSAPKPAPTPTPAVTSAPKPAPTPTPAVTSAPTPAPARVAPAPTPAPAAMPARAAQGAAVENAPAAAASKLTIEYISGPKQAYVGQEITLTCNVSGASAAPPVYVWRFKNGNDVVEKKTGEPLLKITLDKVGEYAITCDVVEAGKTLASQRFNIRVADNPQPATAAACPDGMAAVKGGKICADEYEWPNRRGAAPAANVGPREAAALCEGVGKRLCAPDEWQGTTGFKCCK